MRKTADLTVFQSTITDTLHKGGKPSLLKALYQRIFRDSWLEEKSVIGKGPQATGMTAALRRLSAKLIEEFERASQEVDLVWSQCIEYIFYLIWKLRSQSLEEKWRGTESKLLEVQYGVSAVCDDLRCHVICWSWATVFYQAQSQPSHLPGDLRALHASVCMSISFSNRTYLPIRNPPPNNSDELKAVSILQCHMLIASMPRHIDTSGGSSFCGALGEHILGSSVTVSSEVWRNRIGYCSEFAVQVESLFVNKYCRVSRHMRSFCLLCAAVEEVKGVGHRSGKKPNLQCSMPPWAAAHVAYA